MRPRLPAAETLLPYLRRIDASRIYTNYGPLVQEFEARLRRHFGLPEGAAACASAGTTGLIGAVLAAGGRATPDRPLALIPAFTFVATATAVEQCGYSPYLADVGAVSMALDPEGLLRNAALDRVGVVVPVAPFGRPVPRHRGTPSASAPASRSSSTAPPASKESRTRPNAISERCRWS